MSAAFAVVPAKQQRHSLLGTCPASSSPGTATSAERALLDKQVGGELGITEITVQAHRGQVMRKMQAASLPALVNIAGRLGLPAASAGWSQ